MSKKEVSNEPETGTGVATMPLAVLDLDNILVDDSLNLRRFPYTAKDIEELSNEIVRNGLIEPVVVKPIAPGVEGANGHTHKLVAGYQRMKAIQYAFDNGTVIPVLARVMDVEDGAGVKLANLAENVFRKNLGPVDLAYAVATLKEEGISGKEIASHLKKSPAWVSEVGRLVELRPALQKAVNAGEVPHKLAITLPGLTEEEQDAVIAEYKSGTSANAAAAGVREGKDAKRATKRKKRASKGDVEEGGNGKKARSLKAAINELEELSAVPMVKDEEGKEVAVKETKGEESVRLVFAAVLKYLKGKGGKGALKNQVAKLV